MVGEMFSRHQSDMKLIRNTVKDIDIPEEPIISPVTQFLPRLPTQVATPPPLPDLEPVARRVPQPTTFRFIPGDQLKVTENDKLGGWMNTTRETDTTEFRDLPDGSNKNNRDNESENFSIPASLSSTVYADPPVSLPKHNDHDYPTDNLSTTKYLDPPKPDNLSRTEYAQIGTEAPSDMAISEGALTPSPTHHSDSSIASSYAGGIRRKEDLLLTVSHFE